MNRDKFADFLIQLRKEKSMTQQQVADTVHVSNKSVSKWETGVSVPETETLLALSELFEISVDELLKGERNIPVTQSSKSGQIINIYTIILISMLFIAPVVFWKLFFQATGIWAISYAVYAGLLILTGLLFSKWHKHYRLLFWMIILFELSLFIPLAAYEAIDGMTQSMIINQLIPAYRNIYDFNTNPVIYYQSEYYLPRFLSPQDYYEVFPAVWIASSILPCMIIAFNSWKKRQKLVKFMFLSLLIILCAGCLEIYRQFEIHKPDEIVMEEEQFNSYIYSYFAKYQFHAKTNPDMPVLKGDETSIDPTWMNKFANNRFYNVVGFNYNTHTVLKKTSSRQIEIRKLSSQPLTAGEVLITALALGSTIFFCLRKERTLPH